MCFHNVVVYRYFFEVFQSIHFLKIEPEDWRNLKKVPEGFIGVAEGKIPVLKGKLWSPGK